MARRQPKTCCEQICHRRATSDTRAPGTSVSATIRAFSSADQRRRRPGPVRTSTRRNSPFASSLTSNIRIARSPLPQAHQALRRSPLNKGIRGPLTVVWIIGEQFLAQIVGKQLTSPIDLELRYRVLSSPLTVDVQVRGSANYATLP